MKINPFWNNLKDLITGNFYKNSRKFYVPKVPLKEELDKCNANLSKKLNSNVLLFLVVFIYQIVKF